MGNSQLILVTGSARSGKSEWAEALAVEIGNSAIYVATAQVDANDLEWQARIEKHQRRRPASWTTLQVPFHLAETVENSTPGSCLLVDSLGTWVANFLEQDEASWETTVESLLNSLKHAEADAILVAEETGWGVVPAYPSGRMFRDRLGNLVRRVGAIANAVYLVTGGYALNLSVLGSPVPPSGGEGERERGRAGE